MEGDGVAGRPPEATAAVLLRLAGDQAVENGSVFLDPDRLAGACRDRELPLDAALAALVDLRDDRLVDLHLAVPPVPWVSLLRLTPAGLAAYVQAAGTDLDALRDRVVAALAGGTGAWQGGEAVDLAGAVGAPWLLVEAVLSGLRDAGLVVYSPAPGRRVRVHRFAAPGPPG